MRNSRVGGGGVKDLNVAIKKEEEKKSRRRFLFLSF